MSGNQYTEEEIKSLLQSLYYEKKRVRALQSKIQEVGEERNSLKQELGQREEQGVELALPRDQGILEKKIEKLKAASELSERKWREESLDTKGVKEQYDSLVQDLKLLENRVEERQTLVQSLESRLKEKEGAYQKAEKNTLALRDQLEELKKDSKKVTLRRVVVDDLEGKLQKAQEEKKGLFEELSQVRDESEKGLNRIKHNFQGEKHQLVESLDEKQKALEQLSHQLILASAHRFTIKRQTTFFYNMLHVWKQKASQIDAKNMKDAKFTDELQQKLKQVYEAYQEKDSELKRLNRFFQQVKSGFQDLEEKRNSLEVKKSQLTKRLSEALGCLDLAKSSFSEIEEEISEGDAGSGTIDRLKKIINLARQDIELSNPGALPKKSADEGLSKGSDSKVLSARYAVEKRRSNERKNALISAGSLLEKTCLKLKERESFLKRVLKEHLALKEKSESHEGQELLETKRLRSELKEAKANLDILSGEKSQLSRNLAEQLNLEKEEAKLRLLENVSELESTRSSLESLKNTLAYVESERDQIQNDNKKLLDREALLKEKVGLLQQESSSALQLSLEKDNSSYLEKSLQERIDQLENMQGEYSSLEEENRGNLDRIQAMQGKIEQQAQLQKELERLKETLHALEGEASSREQTDAFRNENETLNKRLETVLKEKHDLNELVSKLEQDLSQGKSESQSFQLDIERYQEKCHNLKERVLLTRQALDKRDKEIDISRKELLKWQEENSKKDTKLRHLNLDDLEKQISLVKQVLVKGVKKTKELETRFVELTQEKISLQVSLSQSQEKLKKLKAKEAQQEELIQGWEERYKGLEKRLKASFEDKEDLSTQLAEAKNLSLEHLHQLKHSEKKLQYHKNELAEKSEEFSFQEKKNEELSLKIGKLTQALSQEKSQRSTLEKNQAEILDHLKASKDRVQDLERSLEEGKGIDLELFSKKKELQQLKENLIRVADESQELSKAKSALTSDLEDKSRSLAEKNSSYESLKTSYAKLYQRSEGVEEQHKNIQSEFDKVQSERTEFAKKVAELHNSNEQLKEHLASLSLERDQSINETAALNSKYVNELKESHGELKQLQADKESLSQSLDTERNRWIELSERAAREEAIAQSTESKFKEEKQRSIELNERMIALEGTEGRLLEEVSVQKQELMQKDAKLKKSLQHLAKKLKETTILHDWAEKQKSRNVDLLRDLEDQRNKVHTLHLEYDKDKEEVKEKLLHSETKLKDALSIGSNLESELKSQSDKLSELQGIKEKYATLSQTFDQLRGLMGGGISIPHVAAEVPPSPVEKSPPVWGGEIKKEEKSPSSTKGLFSAPGNSSKGAKESLF